MSATLRQRRELSVEPQFINRVEIALVGAAINVAAETSSTENHVARADLALKVLRNPSGWAMVVAKGVASHTNVGLGGDDDPSTDSAGGDSALQFVVNSLWDAYTASPVGS